jgi:hypothetical protein
MRFSEVIKTQSTSRNRVIGRTGGDYNFTVIVRETKDKLQIYTNYKKCED